MTNLLSRLFGRSKKGSGATAKDRLRFVLQHDRINLPPERMEEMKREILAVIVKYLVVDQDRVEIDLEQRDRTHSKLTAEIPVAIHTPASANKAVESTVAAADSAGANGANNGANADAEKDDTVDEVDKAEAPDAAEDAKADKRGNGESEADRKS
ncbi:MAG: cell division topological specificity factor MinE [Chloroflexi bacterium]|nr:cell division topological specificity factor MinE [Chloroflexota bacterium]